MHLKWFVPVLLSASALAQQSVPDPGEAEKALRDRVQQFYQLQVEKKYRQAEAYIAADTKDLFYASGKPDLAGFSIIKVVMRDGGTRAEVTVKGKVSMFILGQGMVPMDLPTTGTWKIEDGQWVWYVNPAAGVTTPFGNMKPAAAAPAEPSVTGDISGKIKNFDVKSISNSVTLDTSNVVLATDQASAAATITNGMPGPVELMLLANPVKGIAIDLDKTNLKAGETARVTFTRKADGEASGGASVLVSPLDLRLEIHFTAH